MEELNKTIKKLNEKEFQQLISAVAGNKKNKPYLLLQTARTENHDEVKMMEILDISPTAYYTLKSRLNKKVASFLSRNVQNPINVLKEEVARIPAMMFGHNKSITIRALKELEKQLDEYDLSAELIIVYKALARLHMYTPEYDYYERMYNKRVAFSLSVEKAEDLLHAFIKAFGKYSLTREASDLENIQQIDRELSNIFELYESHRLFVIYNIVKLYKMCHINPSLEGLKAQEMEVDALLQRMKGVFDKYELDTFYQSIKPLINIMYFEYHQRTKNNVRADFYYQSINSDVAELARKPFFSFFITQFLNSKMERFFENKDAHQLVDINDTLQKTFDVDINEIYQYISFKKFIAISKFYAGDYTGSAKVINALRNDIPVKHYPYSDLECKLFQALNYAIIGDDALCNQIISSVKRQVGEDEEINDPVRVFIKMLKAALRPEEFRNKVKKITELWERFNTVNTGDQRLMSFLKMDDALIRRMANPIKE
jgi:hypothetical protein